MSTRSTIQITSKKENKAVILYKHYDSYLSDTLPILKRCFDNSTNFDSFLEIFAKEYSQDLSKIIEAGSGKVYKYTANLYLSEKYCQHGDLEFFYIVDLDSHNISIYGSDFGSESELVSEGVISIPLALRTELLGSDVSITKPCTYEGEK